MANVSNSRGQTAIFPLLLNLDMSNKGSNSPHSDLNDVDVERRRKLLIRLIQVGLSFSHADNDNKSVLHYMREYQLHNRKSKKYDQYENLVKAGNVESNNSVEIKFVLKACLHFLFVMGKLHCGSKALQYLNPNTIVFPEVEWDTSY